ncbi:MAG: hypothetical protein AB7S75_15965 [Desulfococcaceae bacterium]
MPEQKDVKCHKTKTKNGKISPPQRIDKSAKEGQQTEPTANELMFRAWQKIYENRHKRLL